MPKFLSIPLLRNENLIIRTNNSPQRTRSARSLREKMRKTLWSLWLKKAQNLAGYLMLAPKVHRERRLNEGFVTPRRRISFFSGRGCWSRVG